MEDFFDDINYSNVSSPIDELLSSNLSLVNYQFSDDQKIQTVNQNQYQQNIMNKAILPRKKPIFKPHCKWSKEEDEKLKELIIEYGENDWRHLAKKMEGRNSRQCRERWNYYLNPRLKHGKWSDEEDLLILQKHQELGPHWMEISKLFENRTDAMIKNRYKYLIRIKKRSFQCECHILKNNIQTEINEEEEKNLDAHDSSLFDQNVEYFEDISFNNNYLNENEYENNDEYYFENDYIDIFDL